MQQEVQKGKNYMNGKNETFPSLRIVLKVTPVHSFDDIEWLFFIFCLYSYNTYTSNERLDCVVQHTL